MSGPSFAQASRRRHTDSTTHGTKTMDAASAIAFDPRPPVRQNTRAPNSADDFPAILSASDDDRTPAATASKSATAEENARPGDTKDERAQPASAIDLLLLQATAEPIIPAVGGPPQPISVAAWQEPATRGGDLLAVSAPDALKPQSALLTPSASAPPDSGAKAATAAAPAAANSVMPGATSASALSQAAETPTPTEALPTPSTAPTAPTGPTATDQAAIGQAAALSAKPTAQTAKQESAAPTAASKELARTDLASADPSAAAQDFAALDSAPAPQSGSAIATSQAALAQAGAHQNAAAKTASPLEEKAKPSKATGEAEPAPESGKSNAGATKPNATVQPATRQAPTPEAAQPQLQPVAHEQTTATPGADSLGQSGAQAQTAQAATQSAPAQSPALRAHTAAHLAAQITRRFDSGQTSFEVRLDPAELGRVDVRIDMTRDRRVHATISADSALTLSELSKASKDLERALNEAGLDLAEGGLSFSLNDPGQGQDFSGNGNSSARSSYNQAQDRTALAGDMPIGARPLNISRWAGAGLDVWA